MSNQAAIDVRPNRPPVSEEPDRVSQNEAFLDRAETLRLQQEWMRDLDMRQYVSEPCKRYRYRRRVYWLDAESRRLFLDGLKRDAGVLTVATYEAILAGVKSRRDQSLRTLPASASASASAVPAQLAAKARTGDTAVRQLQEVLKLGYFENRRKDRFKYTTRVLLIGDGPIAPGLTRDISETGLQVRAASLGGCQVGDVVKVKFPDVAEIKNARIPYRVIRIAQQLDEFSISLRCERENRRPVIKLLQNLVGGKGESGEGQLRMDAEDASLTAESLLAEYHYMCSTASIPFFLTRDGLRGGRMTVISCNEANEESILAYKTETGGNALAEVISHRQLRHLVKLATVDGRIPGMLAVWRAPDGGDLESLMDLECKTDTDWYASLARHRHEDDFRVFKVVVRRARRPSGHRLAREIEPLAAKSPVHAKQLLRDGRHLVAVGALMDFTLEIRTWNLTPYEAVPAAENFPREDECRLSGGSMPELLPVQYGERMRSQNRYLLRVHATLEIQGETIEAVTSDISRTGMSVLLPEGAQPVALGASVRVTLSDLAEQAGILDRVRKSLERVSYQVVSIDFGKEHLLRLRLQEPDQQRGFTRALSAFLKKQQSTLLVERAHSVDAAASRLYSSFFVEASATLPLLYFRSKADASPLAKVGLTRKPSPLAAFFETADGRFDVSAITAPARTSCLWNQIEQRGRGEMKVFLVKERIPDQPGFRISAVADFEFANRAERGEFLDYVVGKDYRIVRIVMLPPRLPSSPELARVLERLEQYSTPRAARLREEFEDLLAVGDVVDVTATCNEMRYIAP